MHPGEPFALRPLTATSSPCVTKCTVDVTAGTGWALSTRADWVSSSPDRGRGLGALNHAVSGVYPATLFDV